jgi:galactose-1-phosphate uridylyltransferase
VAGFELGTGFFVNVSLPEENAEFLRGVTLPESFQASA